MNNNIYNESDANNGRIIKPQKKKEQMNKIKKIIKEKSIKLRKLPSCQINHGSKHPISNNCANDSNLLNDNINNNIINNNLNLMNDNLSQSQHINFRVGYINNNTNYRYNKKLLNQSQNYQPSSERNKSNIKNLKFMTTPQKIPKKKIKGGITQGNIIKNIKNPNDNNPFENIHFNILGNSNRHLYLQLKKNKASLVKKKIE